MKQKKFNSRELNKIINDQSLRIELASQSHLYFANIYCSHYFQIKYANFHYDLFKVIENSQNKLAVVIAFRGSGKSTIITLTSVLWSIFGKPQKKFVLLVTQSQELAKTLLRNIKVELENNLLLKQDIGPFREVNEVWNAQAITIPKFDAYILAASIDQSIRGVRYKNNRPDLIICDDIEDSQSTKTIEGRQKIKDLYSSEIAPLGGKNTQIIMVGNYLHPNSILNNLKEKIDNNEISGQSIFIPLIDSLEKITWPAKYPDHQSIQELKATIANERIWNREYLLKYTPDNGQIISYDQIDYYDQLPPSNKNKYIIGGLDLAVSLENTADYTALVLAEVNYINSVAHVYIKPYPLNRRLTLSELTNHLQALQKQEENYLVVEGIGFQRWANDSFVAGNVKNVEIITSLTMSKQERLYLVSDWIINKQVHFPKFGCQNLIDQIVNLENENHDDLLDAFTLMLMRVKKYNADKSHPKFGRWLTELKFSLRRY